MMENKLNIAYQFLATGIILNFASIFITAYLHPSKAVLIYFDVFGEANLELSILMLSLILMLRFWFIYLKSIFQPLFEKRAKRKNKK